MKVKKTFFPEHLLMATTEWGDGGWVGVGAAADRRMNKFVCRKTQIFIKICRRPQI